MFLKDLTTGASNSCKGRTTQASGLVMKVMEEGPTTHAETRSIWFRNVNSWAGQYRLRPQFFGFFCLVTNILAL